MTDKMQKIHEEIKMIVNRRLNLLNGDYFDLNKEVDGFTNEIMDIVNSLQEEPVSEDLHHIVDTKAKELWDEMNTGHEYSIIDSYSQFYGICMEIAESIKKEPVSGDLEEAAWFYADKKCHLDIAVFTSDEVKKEREKMQFTWQDLYDAVMFGAKWQKEKDSILPKVWNRENLDEFSYQTAYDLSNDWMKEIPTWDDVEIACKLGAKWQKSKDQSTIELAEDHAYFAGSEAMREKILREIEEAYKKGGVIEAMKIIRELKGESPIY